MACALSCQQAIVTMYRGVTLDEFGTPKGSFILVLLLLCFVWQAGWRVLCVCLDLVRLLVYVSSS